MNEILKAALNFISRNKSVIPVGKDKRPLLEWKEFQTRIASEEEVRKWFENPEAQVGIVTGEISNLLVVDIDDPNMDRSWLPKTTVIKTGSGGYHYYYQYAPGISNKAGIMRKVDIRGDGGFVVAPPSENQKGKYKVIDASPISPFPLFLFGSKDKQYIPAGVEYQGFGKGQRNDQMTRWVGHLLAKIHPSEWRSIAWPLTQEANQKNTPPLNEYELKNVFDSIANKENRNPAKRWFEGLKEMKLKVKTNYQDRYTWGTNVLDRTLGIIKRGNFIIIGAKRGQGKTTYTFDLAMKNALLGHKVLYISLEMEEEKIISDFARKYSGITIEEEYHHAIPNHKQTAFDKKFKEIKGIEGLYFRGMRRGTGTSWENVLDIIDEFDELDLIILDNLDLVDGRQGENDMERQKRVTKEIMKFTEEKQVPLILIHHHRKSNGQDYGADELSGSGKIADNADMILKIVRQVNCDDYPEKYMSRLYMQKCRGYQEASGTIYFIKGSFVDEPPTFKNYEN